MKHISFIALLLALTVNIRTHAATLMIQAAPAQMNLEQVDSGSTVSSISIEKQHLSFKDRIALSVLKKKLKKWTGIQNNPDGELNIWALLGFIFSILTILFFPFAIIGLVFSIIGLRQIKKEPDHYSGKPFAIAGIVVSVVMLVLTLAIVGLYLSFLFA